MELQETNQPKKDYNCPMHTAEHILNATMVSTFGCPRSKNAHIEKKKSKCDYELPACPTPEEMQAIEDKVNEVIKMNLPVSIEFMSRQEAASIVDLSKLPEEATDTLRIVRVGHYDACACIGAHVDNTSEISNFKIISYDYNDERGVLRMRFKLVD